MVCKKCGEIVHGTLRKQHILRVHLNKPMYRCGYCDFSSPDRKATIQIHLGRIHPSLPALVLEELSTYKNEIDAFKQECFDMKIGVRGRDTDTLLEEMESLSRKDEQDRNKAVKRARLETTVTLMKDRQINPAICKLCGTKVKDAKKRMHHVTRVHLHKKLFFCGYCQFSSRVERHNVVRHIRRTHGKECEELIRDETQKWRKRILELQRQCFGTATAFESVAGGAKSAAGRGGERKRETEECRECGMKIRQQAKTFHILGFHLKKPVYLCGYCPFFTQAERFKCTLHVKKTHPEESQVLVKNELSKYASELSEWRQRCFGQSSKVGLTRQNKEADQCLPAIEVQTGSAGGVKVEFS